MNALNMACKAGQEVEIVFSEEDVGRYVIQEWDDPGIVARSVRTGRLIFVPWTGLQAISFDPVGPAPLRQPTDLQAATGRRP